MSTAHRASSSHRLPRSVEPVRYDITLSPDLDAGTFAGEERVLVRVLEPVAEMVLNAVALDVSSAELLSAGGRRLEGTVGFDEAEERLVVSLGTEIDPGEWTLHLTFAGALDGKLRGFYRSTFTDGDGVGRVIAATQFEATDARRAFPCWDEPDFKAVFGVTLIVDAGLVAISNSPAAEERDLGTGKRQVRFADTMRMSTYLVAFVVGPLEVTDPADVDGTPVRIACVPGKAHLSAFAQETAAHALRFFTRYFGLPYPAEKLDLIALPDFAMGAMENLGAVTFRESLLLIDPATATRVELERTADVIAHEIAHMWFGDLVTMKWWNGLWLNEAFATFMELLCVDDLRPEWRRWVSFGLNRAAAMVTDGLRSTRAIEFPVARPSEAEEMFDVLTYQKGAGVLRMLEQYLGPDAFRQGIVRYIGTHQYGNTETSDLWDAIEAETGEPVRATMDSWIHQGGHPLVTASPGPDGTSLTLSQRRFRYAVDGDAHGAVRAGGPERWHVPVLVRAGVAGGVERRRVLLDGETARVELDGPVDWAVVNDGGWGVYRVGYSPELLRALTADLGRLDALERFNLVSDAWAAVLAALSPVSEFLALARLFGDEDDPSVWAAVLGPLGTVERALEDGGAAWLRSFVRSLVRPAFERVGWEPAPGEEETTRTLRATLLRALGVLGVDDEVRARALALAMAADAGAADPDVAGAVVAVVADAGGPGEYDEFARRWRAARTPQDELRYLYALAGFRERELVERTFEIALRESRSQNGPFLVSLLLQNRSFGTRAWDLVKDHWDELVGRFPPNLVDRMLDGVTALATPELAADVRAFLAAHPVPARARSVEQMLERLDVHVAFRLRERAALAGLAASPGSTDPRGAVR